MSHFPHTPYKNSISSLTKQEILAFCIACSLFLSSIEYLFPRPVPFFRFGLSNIVILLILRNFKVSDIFFVLILRVFATGILHGTIASYVFLFSLSGAISAVCMQWIVITLLKQRVGLLGISIIGAATSNTVQVIFSVLFIFGTSSIIIAPYLLLLGCISGIVVGLIAEYYYRNSQFLGLLYQQYAHSLAKGT